MSGATPCGGSKRERFMKEVEMYKVQKQEDGSYVIVDKDGAIVGDTFFELRREALAEAKRLNEMPVDAPGKTPTDKDEDEGDHEYR